MRSWYERIRYKFSKALDRKSTRLNSSHSQISYAVFCLKKKKKQLTTITPAYKQNEQIQTRHHPITISRQVQSPSFNLTHIEARLRLPRALHALSKIRL